MQGIMQCLDHAHNGHRRIHFNHHKGVSMRSSRRVFMMQMATAASAVLVAQQASAQAMVAENDPQAAGVATRPTPARSTRPSTPSTPPVRTVPAAPCTRARPVRPAVVAACSRASRWRPRAGARPTPRRPDPARVSLAHGLGTSPPKPGARRIRFFFRSAIPGLRGPCRGFACRTADPHATAHPMALRTMAACPHPTPIPSPARCACSRP